MTDQSPIRPQPGTALVRRRITQAGQMFAGIRARFAAARKQAAARALAIAYSPDAVAIEESPEPAAAYGILYTIIAFLLVAVMWASLSHVDRVVSAEGKLVTTAPRITIQPLETSVVRAIEVRPGQIVREGQVLARLDPTFADADAIASRKTLVSVTAQIKRLEAELTGHPGEPFDPAIPDDALESQTLARKRAEHEAQLRALDGELADLSAQLATARADQAQLRNQLAILKENEEMRRTLMQKEYSSRLSWLDARYQRGNLDRDLEKSINAAKEVQHRLDAARAKREKYEAERRAKLGEELATAKRERNRLQEQARKAERLSTLVELTAPRRAVVLELAHLGAGSVVRQADTLMSLVPLDVPLEAEVSVHPRDIGYLRIDDTARIKVEAFPFQKHGVLEGRLTVIGEDIVEETVQGTKLPLYRVRVAMPAEPRLKDVPKDYRLIPGMTVTAEIKVGERSVISYFLYPVIRAFDTGLREP